MSSLALFYYVCCIVIFCTVIQGAEDGGNEKKLPPEICRASCLTNMNNTRTGNFCHIGYDKVIQWRCCVNTTDNTVLGIDLENCNMTNTVFSAGIKNLSNLLYISLQENDGLKQVSREDFHRNTNIQYLSLPLGMGCPGNSDSWSKITNSTTENATICQEELDPCHVHNVSCPANSHCVHSGVGLTECLCDDGFHGYKCMNQGKFPTVPFVVGIAIPTVFLSALLWVTQRRYVKPSNKNK
ncbi:hypothetical protein BsWGS_02918 [Bradybaena similaris]